MPLALAPVPPASLHPARVARFARLGEAPELYVELMIPTSRAWALAWDGQPVGHAIVGADGALLELELAGDAPAEALFAELRARLGIGRVLAYSFDRACLDLCDPGGQGAEVVGPLFRSFADPRLPAPPGASLRPAVPADEAWILPHREGVFERDDEVGEWLRRGLVTACEVDGEPAGIGLLTPVWPERPERDVGVMVLPRWRRRGLAAFVLASLARRCAAEGGRPTAGCAADNLGSRGALRRAGFAETHALLLVEGHHLG